MLTAPATTSSILGVVTTIHLALAALANHRHARGTPVSATAAVSILFAASPWLLPSVPGVALGLALHVIWFGICEWLKPAAAPSPAAARAATTSTAGRTASPGRPLPAAPARSAPAGTTSRGFVAAPIIAVIAETPSIRTIRFARPEGFHFEAGQFVTVRIQVDGREHARCYSISSAPSTPGYLEISVRAQGVVSNALHATARPGAMLSIKGPVGAFKYPSADHRPIVLLAGGIGITPLISMLRHAVLNEPTRPVSLIYSAKSVDDFAFRDELTSIGRRHPQARIIFAVSGGSASPHFYSGRIDEGLLRNTVPDLSHSIAYICGPQPMIDGLRALLGSLAMSPAQIRYEVFSAAIAAAGAEGQAARARPARAARSPFEMSCTASNVQVPIHPGQTILEAAEQANVPVASLCRAGVCGTCRVRVAEGEVDCESTALDPADQAEGYVLACVSTVRSSCAVHV